MMLAVFFALNRPNYDRWDTLFLLKLENTAPKLRKILEEGVFSIRQTKKNYSRSAVDLSLEQTVNINAVSSMRGIVFKLWKWRLDERRMLHVSVYELI